MNALTTYVAAVAVAVTAAPATAQVTKTIPGETQVVTATVEAIERASREVTVKKSDGQYDVFVRALDDQAVRHAESRRQDHRPVLRNDRLAAEGTGREGRRHVDGRPSCAAEDQAVRHGIAPADDYRHHHGHRSEQSVDHVHRAARLDIQQPG